MLTENECIANDRLTTYVSNDVSNSEPLSPNHFLLKQYGIGKDLHIRFNNKKKVHLEKWIQVQTIESVDFQNTSFN